MKKTKKNRGFTLIEILVVIGLIAILAAVVLIAINPARQFAQARNSQRTSNVNAILNAVGQRMVDNKGLFQSPTGACSTALPTAVAGTLMRKTGGYDIRNCLLPYYMPEVPVDPSTGSITCSSDAACATGDYNTGYTVAQDSTTKRVTVCAPEAANETAIQPVPITICITR